MESYKRKGAGEDRAIAHTLLLSEFDYTGNNGKKQAVSGFWLLCRLIYKTDFVS